MTLCTRNDPGYSAEGGTQNTFHKKGHRTLCTRRIYDTLHKQESITLHKEGPRTFCTMMDPEHSAQSGTHDTAQGGIHDTAQGGNQDTLQKEEPRTLFTKRDPGHSAQ
ncbi:hypothetical protein EYF80_033973 [Liparis tanakae]|uniref:Uncharacterized protein n=1 Tax=Liparis tanakae TaxID=230148 RepID=A0A4Z2GR72_9TELE|nr:hypothetical protein EYF80_033973 [Liparis tanakae]